MEFIHQLIPRLYKERGLSQATLKNIASVFKSYSNSMAQEKESNLVLLGKEDIRYILGMVVGINAMLVTFNQIKMQDADQILAEVQEAFKPKTGGPH